MKTTTALLVLGLCALALAAKKPPGTVVPAQSTDPPKTTTTTPKTTTPKTTTPKTTPTTTNTTTPKTTTPKTTPTTTNTTTPKTTPTTPKTTTPKTTTPKTTTPKTTTTTPKTTTPKTTTPKTTTTTPKTTTTTPKTTTTTPKPTTTTPKPTTTTPKPTTTTLPPTTTQPPKATNSTVGNYTLDNGKHRCLMAQMEVMVRLVSEKANGTFLLLPNKTRTAGDCNDNRATLLLISKELNITFSYSKNATTKKSFVNMLAFNLTYDFSKKSNGEETYRVNNQSIHAFEARLGKSYSCRKESLYMGDGLYLNINHDRMQAFNFTDSNEFGTTDPCSADQNNYRVAIAVGITLLVLIVVVVVAYLLARKKRTDGYQSL